MRSLGLCVGMVLAAAGCHTGGTLTGSGGAGTLSGVGGRVGGIGGVGSVVVEGSGGAGPIITGASGSSGLDVCNRLLTADPVPPKVMLLLDTSASMNAGIDPGCADNCGYGSKWSAAVSGINYELAYTSLDPWGLELIGSGGGSCNAGGVAVAAASGNAEAVTAALNGHTAAGEVAVPGNRPTRAAVSAAAAHLAMLTAPGNAAIVLMTDGLPNCDGGEPRASDYPGTLEEIATIRTTGIPTFVIGIGALDPATDDALSRLAVEGGMPRAGTPTYYPAKDMSDIVDVLQQVITGSCTFAIPFPPSLDGVTSRENIGVVIDGMAVPQDANNGWTYSDSTHTTFTLHGVSCDAIDDGGHYVSVVFRCPLL